VFKIVVIGTSMGGMQALQTLLAALPAEFPLPVVVVQHRSSDSGDALRASLQRYSQLRLREPVDKEPVEAGKIYLAPADYHLMLEDRSFALATDEPVSYARPSVDVLFESAADAYGGAVIAVVLTGANHDGARGVSRVKDSGGFVIVQDPDEADRPEMPRAAIGAAAVDAVLSLSEIGPHLLELAEVSNGRTHAGR